MMAAAEGVMEVLVMVVIVIAGWEWKRPWC